MVNICWELRVECPFLNDFTCKMGNGPEQEKNGEPAEDGAHKIDCPGGG